MSKIRPTIDVIGVPLDLGANMRGANIGPASVRIAGLSKMIQNLDLNVRDLGDLQIPVREELSPEIKADKYLPVIKQVCESLYSKVSTSFRDNHFPLIIGGDHSLVLGSIGAASDHMRAQKKELGVIWIDAHADLNNPTSSPSGNIHGMPLAILLGDGDQRLTTLGAKKGPKLKPENIALIGIRNIDGREKELVRKSGIQYFTMRSIDEKGMFKVMEEALAAVLRTADALHLSFDIDGIDPLYAPGVSTPCSGGISYREAHLALEMIADTGKLISAEFVELNPFQDQAHKTALLTVELILSALGKSIV